MAAPGLTKLFDKLNIVEIQIRNVLFKSICCGVFKRPEDHHHEEHEHGNPTVQNPMDNQIMQSRHEEPALGTLDVDYMETRSQPTRTLTTQSAPAVGHPA